MLNALIETFRSLLPSHLTFHFMDAELDAEPDLNVAGVYPGPYLAFYPNKPTGTDIMDAYESVLEVIEKEGPFDGVIGFSQVNRSSHTLTGNLTQEKGAALAASMLLQHGNPNIGSPWRFAIFISSSLPFDPATDGELNICHQYGPTTHDKDGIRIPTAHIMGRADPYYAQSKALAALCNPRSLKVFEHSEGHFIPRTAKVTKEIRRIIEDAMNLSCLVD